MSSENLSADLSDEGVNDAAMEEEGEQDSLATKQTSTTKINPLTALGVESHYEVGDLVWAKPFAHHPIWPAQIADFRRSTSYLDRKRKPGDYLVYFFASHDFLNLSAKNMAPFRNIAFDAMAAKCTTKKLVDALKEARDVEKDETSKFSCLENDEMCCVCFEGGDVILCEGPCRRSFHEACLAALPNAPPVTSNDYFCASCSKMRQVRDFNRFVEAANTQPPPARLAQDDAKAGDVADNSDSDLDNINLNFESESEDSVHGEAHADAAILEVKKPKTKTVFPPKVKVNNIGPAFETIREILKKVLKHPHAWPFRAPMDKKMVDYYRVIKNPMDLGTVKAKLVGGEYRSLPELISDVNLVFENCRAYFAEGTETRKLGERMAVYFAKEMQHSRRALWAGAKEAPSWWTFGVPEKSVKTFAELNSITKESDMPLIYASASPMKPGKRKADDASTDVYVVDQDGEVRARRVKPNPDSPRVKTAVSVTPNTNISTPVTKTPSTTSQPSSSTPSSTTGSLVTLRPTYPSKSGMRQTQAQTMHAVTANIVRVGHTPVSPATTAVTVRPQTAAAVSQQQSRYMSAQATSAAVAQGGLRTTITPLPIQPQTASSQQRVGAMGTLQPYQPLPVPAKKDGINGEVTGRRLIVTNTLNGVVRFVTLGYLTMKVLRASLERLGCAETDNVQIVSESGPIIDEDYDVRMLRDGDRLQIIGRPREIPRVGQRVSAAPSKPLPVPVSRSTDAVVQSESTTTSEKTSPIEGDKMSE